LKKYFCKRCEKGSNETKFGSKTSICLSCISKESKKRYQRLKESTRKKVCSRCYRNEEQTPFYDGVPCICKECYRGVNYNRYEKAVGHKTQEELKSFFGRISIMKKVEYQGEGNPNASLTAGLVRKIRELRDQGRIVPEIIKLLNLAVSRNTVYDVYNNKSWKSVK